MKVKWTMRKKSFKSIKFIYFIATAPGVAIN